MKNSTLDKIYHWYVVKRYSMHTHRGSWMLTRSYINDYKRGVKNFINIHKAHRAGFCYSDYLVLGIEDRRDKCLTTRDYCSLHPFNGSCSAWIDDKLTLKYILNGTSLQQYMPEYYFQINNSDSILALTDNTSEFTDFTVDSIIRLLEEKKCLAFKKIKASLGAGFIKAEFIQYDNVYLLNSKKFSRKQLYEELCSLNDYLVMEFLEPHPQFAKYSKESLGCLRYLIGRRLSGDMVEILSFMRFGTKQSGSVENYNAGGILTYVKNGIYNGGHMLDFKTMKDISVSHHPNNNEELRGYIPKWSEIEQVAFKIADLLPQLNYMGIDFAITKDEKIKILEVNSLTSLDAMELEQSVYDMPHGDFFKERLELLQ